MGRDDVRVYLHANVTRLEIGGPAEDTITKVHVMNYNGRAFVCLARQIVVSTGVIESARLLLASNVGNDFDQVGRFFHDHIGIHAATLRSTARERAIRLFAPRVNGRVLYTPKLEASTNWRGQHGAQAVMAHFPIIEPDDSAIATIRMILQTMQRKQLTPGLFRRLATLPSGFLELLQMAYSTKILKRRALSKHSEYRLNIDVEQSPQHESRISLSENKDRFGMPRVPLNWKISEREIRTVQLFVQKIQAELRTVAVAPIEMNPLLLEDGGSVRSIISDTYHMMGGTRMGSTKEDSVVDANLKVHGMQNLYVAGCSVFPSGGSSNPTFTMMALTLRLAELLRRKFLPV